jgi:hypothetical protein
MFVFSHDRVLRGTLAATIALIGAGPLALQSVGASTETGTMTTLVGTTKADGVAQDSYDVLVTDVSGAPVAGHMIRLTLVSGSKLVPVGGTTDLVGHATLYVSSTRKQTATLGVIDTATGDSLGQVTAVFGR